MCIQEGVSPLFVAVEANEYGTASKLIQKGASVNLVKVSNKIIIICDWVCFPSISSSQEHWMV